MKGWKTLILNLLAVLSSVLALKGIELTPEQQAELATNIIALIGVANIIMRNFTNCPPGWLNRKGNRR